MFEGNDLLQLISRLRGSFYHRSDPGIIVDGGLLFSGLARRIKGDLSNATVANRLLFQNTNAAQSQVGVIPGAGATGAFYSTYAQADPDNASQMAVGTTASFAYVLATKTGTGTQLPLQFQIGGAEAFRITVNRALLIGRTSAAVLTDAVGMIEVEGSVSVKTSTVHIAIAAPGSPLDGESWNDSTRKARAVSEAGITQNLVGCIFTGTADATVGNTTTETSIMPTGIGTLTLPANFWTIGKSVRIRLRGIISKGTTSVTRKYTLYHGAVTIKTNTTAAGTTAITNQGWEFEAVLTCRSTGATGTIMAHMRQFHYGLSDPTMELTATTTIDTTASALLDYKFQWSANDAANNMVTQIASVEVLN